MVRRLSTGAQQFRNMLRLAREMGCQIQPGTENPHILTGLCPFHEARTLHEAKTLHVDTGNARFWCITCHATGNPLAFIAKVWGITGQDAHEFIQEGREVTRERPRRSPEAYRETNSEGPPPQNTAILTMATRFYSQQVKQSFTALHYLARMGIKPDDAIRAGFGYCGGDGLAEYLERRRADREEIEESPLFQDVTGLEILSGWLTMSDIDFTGGTIWMTGVAPDDGSETWPAPGRPRMRGLQGRRNRLFNIANIYPHSQGITITDDARLYLVMKTSGFVPALTTAVRTPANAPALSDRISGTLLSRNPGSVVMAMHDQELGRRIEREIRQKVGELPVEHRDASEITNQLNPERRDLRWFTRGDRAQEEQENHHQPELPATSETPPGVGNAREMEKIDGDPRRS